MMVEQSNDGKWRVISRGVVIIEGIANSEAWQFIDKNDVEAQDSEETRERISKAIGQW